MLVGSRHISQRETPGTITIIWKGTGDPPPSRGIRYIDQSQCQNQQVSFVPTTSIGGTFELCRVFTRGNRHNLHNFQFSTLFFVVIKGKTTFLSLFVQKVKILIKTSNFVRKHLASLRFQEHF